MYSKIKECLEYTSERCIQGSSFTAFLTWLYSTVHIVLNIYLRWNTNWCHADKVKTVKDFSVYLSLRLETDRERIFFLHGFLRCEAETVSLGIPSDGGTEREDMSMCTRERERARARERACVCTQKGKGQSVSASTDDATRGRRCCWFWLSFVCYEIFPTKVWPLRPVSLAP